MATIVIELDGRTTLLGGLRASFPSATWTAEPSHLCDHRTGRHATGLFARGEEEGHGSRWASQVSFAQDEADRLGLGGVDSFLYGVEEVAPAGRYLLTISDPPTRGAELADLAA